MMDSVLESGKCMIGFGLRDGFWDTKKDGVCAFWEYTTEFDKWVIFISSCKSISIRYR